MSDERFEQCWKVVHCRDNIESVYLVTATHSRQARDEVKWNIDLGHKCDANCTWATMPYRPEPAYFLYAINKMTGDMSPGTSNGGKSMCFVCLGNIPGV